MAKEKSTRPGSADKLAEEAAARQVVAALGKREFL